MFTKLFARITESSLMEEEIPVRYTFVMLMAIADRDGDVVGTDVAIARRLNMPLAEFRRCVGILGQPDQDSNSKECDGKRVIPSDNERGYKVVNYVKYRNLKTDFDKKSYMREYMQEYRRKTPLEPLDTHCLTSASASASDPGMESAERKGYHRDARVVLHILNEASGRHFRETDSNLSFISERLHEHGVDLAGVRQMIIRQCERWNGTVQAEFLRPETLFNKTKFDAYYAARDLPVSRESQNAGPKPETLAEKKVRSL